MGKVNGFSSYSRKTAAQLRVISSASRAQAREEVETREFCAGGLVPSELYSGSSTDEDSHEVSLSTIAKELGLTKEMVRKIEKEALAKLKKRLELMEAGLFDPDTYTRDQDNIKKDKSSCRKGGKASAKKKRERVSWQKKVYGCYKK